MVWRTARACVSPHGRHVVYPASTLRGSTGVYMPWLIHERQNMFTLGLLLTLSGHCLVDDSVDVLLIYKHGFGME